MTECVIVTVKRKDDAQVRDLDVPVNTPAEHLASIVAMALGWNVDTAGNPIYFEIEVHFPNGRTRRLQSNESLAEVDAWDGCWLVFHPQTPILVGSAEKTEDDELKTRDGYKWIPID
jgi:hypothetical protein